MNKLEKKLLNKVFNDYIYNYCYNEQKYHEVKSEIDHKYVSEICDFMKKYKI